MIDKKSILEIVNNSEAVYLGTVDGLSPRIRALVNLRRADLYPKQSAFCRREDFVFYLATSRASSKVQEIERNPEVSFYYCQPCSFHGVMFAGRAEIVSDQELKDTLWDDSWSIYWPAGQTDNDYVVLRLSPKQASGWWGSKPFEVELDTL